MREVCTKHGALLIFDEVMTGFRVARGGAQEICGMRPDLTALGKVIGGGLPVGAFGGRADIMDQLSPDGPVYQAGTLSGNPLAMAAGLAQLRELERIDGWRRLEATRRATSRGDADDSLGKTAASRPFFIASARCSASFSPTAPVTDLATAKRSDLDEFVRFFQSLPRAGVYFAPSQFETGFHFHRPYHRRRSTTRRGSCARRCASLSLG